MNQYLSSAYIKEKWGHVGFQKYFKNTGWMFGGRIFTLVISFFIGVYIARYLGPSNYGLLSYVFSFVGLFSFIASLGIENIANREIIKDHSKKDIIIGTSFYLKIFGSFIAVLITFIFAFLSTKDLMLLGLIGMYSLTFIFSAFNIVETYFQSQALSKYPALVATITVIISLILKVLVVYLGYGIIWLTAIYVLESILVAVGLLFFFIRSGHNINDWVFDKKIAGTILKDSWPLMLSTIAWGIYMKIDQVMIKNILGNEQVGIYAVAAKLSEFWYFIPSTICASVFPAIMNAKKMGGDMYEKRLSKLYSLIFYISLTIAICTTLFASLVILLLFGEQYISAITTLKIYVWSGVGASITTVLTYYLVSENQTKITALATTIGAITNIALNFILIPKFGINGAALATLISYTFVSLSILFSHKGKSQFSIILKGIILPFNKNK